jgi:uncharacterized protein
MSERSDAAATKEPGDARCLDDLSACLRGIGSPAIALSGGVDSMTLAAFAHRLFGNVEVLHATSPAVPPEATRRVREWATREGWQLRVLDAGEFADARYRANPVDRCFFCKTNLYDAIARVTGRQVLSGANTDDLGEYRPGLVAAAQHAVRHPYVEAAIDKAAVRRLARHLDLGDVADLPAAPCLSSRVETGIRIEPETLAMIHAVETDLRAMLIDERPTTVRCRVRADAIVVELDAATLSRIGAERTTSIEETVRRHPAAGTAMIRVEPYRVGSAFIQVRR